MPSLRQAARSTGNLGQPLPDVFPALAELGVQLRRGHTHVIAAAPGVGKSVVSIVTSLRMGFDPVTDDVRTPPVLGLYLAMDGDERSMCIRVIQSVANLDRYSAEQELDSGGLLAKQVLDTVTWVRFDFPNRPDIVEITHRVWAFAEIHGEFPHLVVIDNLMDVVEEQSSKAYSEAEQDLTALARASNAAVVALHHVMGIYEGSTDVIPMSGLLYKPSKKVSLALTMNPGASPGVLWVSVLKNRDGPADPSGLNVRAQLEVDYSRMQAW